LYIKIYSLFHCWLQVIGFMEKRDIIVIGSSAGGVNALQEIVASLPQDLNASIFIVQHVTPGAISLLPRILTYKGNLNAAHPADGEIIRQGMIYVAPPDHHMIIERDRILVKKGPKENRFRPSIDALFRSAAYSYGPRVIGVVLTGMLDDGTSGMWSVKRLGGIGIIQTPEDAAFPSMPNSVLEYVKVDHVLPLSEIAHKLAELVNSPAVGAAAVDAAVDAAAVDAAPVQVPELERMKTEIEIAAQKFAFEKGVLDMGELSALTCPECHGVLTRLREGNHSRYRCHTGHAYLSSALLNDLVESVEVKLWQALKSLEETVILLEQDAEDQGSTNNTPGASDLLQKAEIARDRANKLHDFIYDTI
jgi:two-component system chemotaxis response regulator CheB